MPKYHKKIVCAIFVQIIFRKIADVKREQERQKGDVTLSIPEDHPVRKLFQKFRQQRDTQTPGESHFYLDHNCVQVELQRQHHHFQADSNSYSHCQTVSSQLQEFDSSMDNSAPCTGGGGGGGGAGSRCSLTSLPQAFVPDQSCTEEMEESLSRSHAVNQLCQIVHSRSEGSAAGAEGSGSSEVTSSRGARGWSRFRTATSAAPAPPAGEKKKQLQKPVEWSKGSPSSQQTSADRQSEESRRTGCKEGGNSAAEGSEETSALHKTDSCDSGITKSDLRIDRAGASRYSFERSPLDKSPVERSSYQHGVSVEAEASVKLPFVQPVSEQSLLQATLHEAKQELKGDIQILSGRLSALESRVNEILRLLSIKRRLSLPPTSSPRPRVRSQDTDTASRSVTPKDDDGPF